MENPVRDLSVDNLGTVCRYVDICRIEWHQTVDRGEELLDAASPQGRQNLERKGRRVRVGEKDATLICRNMFFVSGMYGQRYDIRAVYPTARVRNVTPRRKKRNTPTACRLSEYSHDGC